MCSISTSYIEDICLICLVSLALKELLSTIEDIDDRVIGAI